MDLVFIYSTRGDWEATRVGNYIFDLVGQWVAWVDGSEVFTCDGEYVGYLSRDHRILRKRAKPLMPLRNDIPPNPGRLRLPARAPLPPMFAELSYSEVDMFDWDPDIFKRVSELRPDMD
jgi:hypothetical protein